MFDENVKTRTDCDCKDKNHHAAINRFYKEITKSLHYTSSLLNCDKTWSCIDINKFPVGMNAAKLHLRKQQKPSCCGVPKAVLDKDLFTR